MNSFPSLAAGARIALVAPAGPLKLPADLDRAISNARILGLDPVVGEHVREQDGYLAGPDDKRLGDLNAALCDPFIDGVWCLRGGYGAMRLLEKLDYDALRKRPKVIIGYSDVTALHCAIQRNANLATIHGPTARATLTAFSERSLRAALAGADSCGSAPDARTLVGGQARGRLVGGNLALLSALHGTPFQPSYAGAILVLEDVNEAPYRIERMLLQLRLSGDLQRCAGIVFGSFTNTGETSDRRPGRPGSLEGVLQEAAETAGVPAIAGAPIGHLDDQWSIPLGLDAELDADSKRLTVTV